MGLGIFEGWVEGYAENLVIECDIMIDMYDFFIFMQDFRVTSIGKIDVRLKGNILTDWLGNIIIDIITTLFRTTVTEMVSDRVKVFVQATIDDINSSRLSRGGVKSSEAMVEMLRSTLAKQGIKLPEHIDTARG